MAVSSHGFALFVLFLAPVIAMWAYRRKTAAVATIGCMLGFTLFLPELAFIDPPLLPRLDKHTLASLSMLLGAFATNGARVRSTPWFGGAGWWLGLSLLGTVGTALTNPETLVYGPVELEALTLYDALSMSIEDMLNMVLPFFLGRAFFRTSKSLRTLMVLIVGWTLFYSVFVLLEVRLAPQLHKWVYGYRQHSFAQASRGDGYRPMVFMEHGLAVAIFLVSTIMCSASLRNVVPKVWRFTPGFATLYLVVVLVLCKSMGALVFTIIALPVVLYATPRAQVAFAAALAAIVLLYPVLRVNGAIPTTELVEYGRQFGDDERAWSLQFRFANEDMLLQRAMERPWFGWGANRRARVFSADGRDLTTIDGYWIILLGQRGWVGTFAGLGALAVPILMLRRRFGTFSPRDRTLLAGLAIALVLAAADLLPNGLFTRVPYMLAGALVGLIEGLPASYARARRDLVRDAQPITA